MTGCMLLLLIHLFPFFCLCSCSCFCHSVIIIIIIIRSSMWLVKHGIEKSSSRIILQIGYGSIKGCYVASHVIGCCRSIHSGFVHWFVHCFRVFWIIFSIVGQKILNMCLCMMIRQKYTKSIIVRIYYMPWTCSSSSAFIFTFFKPNWRSIVKIGLNTKWHFVKVCWRRWRSAQIWSWAHVLSIPNVRAHNDAGTKTRNTSQCCYMESSLPIRIALKHLW